MVSVIIPAYKTSDYIEECLDSVQNQSYLKNNNINYEILVGVDGCEKTLNKLSEIKYKYNNLKIINMVVNKGLFITINTLIYVSKYDLILKFDSDDIMVSDLIDKVIIHDADMVRFSYYDLYNKNDNWDKYNIKLNKEKNNIIEQDKIAKGVFLINKKVFNDLGGFEPWQCSADTEFLNRFTYNKYKEVILKDKLFYYRRHNNSLSIKHYYKDKKSLRNKYKEIINNKKYNQDNIKVNPVINTFDIIE